MKEKLNSEEMNYVSGGYGSDGPRISCGEAKDIAWNYIHEAGHYVGMPRYSLDNCWEVPVYNADGIECGNIIIDANSGEVLSFFVGC
jgi:hypothetical protein